MTEPRIQDLPAAMSHRDHPTVGIWNRLEGRPRTTDFDRALRAEVRDPLWMLARQWQLGEFRGTDGGSPVTATYSVTASPPGRFRSDADPTGPAGPLPSDRPLESTAERRPLPFSLGTEPISFDLRLLLASRWLKLLARFDVFQGSGLGDQYVALYPITLPDPAKPVDAARVAHPDVWASMQAVAGRRLDGYLLYQYLKAGGHASDGISVLGQQRRAALDALGPRLVSWFDDLIDQPTGVTPQRPAGNSTWDPRRLEHRFSVSTAAPAGGELVLTPPDYPGGELDWHAFSVARGDSLGGTGQAPVPMNRTVFPASVRFSGMPLPRWWAVEDGRTNFAAVTPDSTDLARLISWSSPSSTATTGTSSRATCRPAPWPRSRAWRSPMSSGSAAGSFRPAAAPSIGSTGRCSPSAPSPTGRPSTPGCSCHPVPRRSPPAQRSRTSHWSGTRARTWSGASNRPCDRPPARAGLATRSQRRRSPSAAG
jgi:hypothetical protein